MILSIIIYTITALLLYQISLCFVSRPYGQNTTSNLGIPFYGILFVFGIVVGARYDVGVDHLAYLFSYENCNTVGIRDDMEAGFAVVTKWMYNCGFHYFFYFALWGILQIGFIYQALKYNKRLLPYVGLLIMLGPYFLNWMNGIRQTVVACFFVLLVSKCVVGRKYILYVIFIFFASKFHNSALLLLPFIILGYYNFDIKNKWVGIAILIFCTILGSMPFWVQYLSDFQNVLELMGYGERYGNRFEEMLGGEDFSTFAWGPMRTSDYIIDLLILWFYPDIRRKNQCDAVLPVFFSLYFIGACSYNLFAGTNQIFLRVVMYFTIFKLPMTAYLLCYLKSTNKKTFYFASFVAFAYIYIVIFKSSLPSAANTLQRCNLYKFFFFERLN